LVNGRVKTPAAKWLRLFHVRGNVADWSDEELSKTRVQLSGAQAALRIHKFDLCLRPIYDIAN
jgi:hypothetical protein